MSRLPIDAFNYGVGPVDRPPREPTYLTTDEIAEMIVRGSGPLESLAMRIEQRCADYINATRSNHGTKRPLAIAKDLRALAAKMQRIRTKGTTNADDDERATDTTR